jgi:hypothetical protein
MASHKDRVGDRVFVPNNPSGHYIVTKIHDTGVVHLEMHSAENTRGTTKHICSQLGMAFEIAAVLQCSEDGMTRQSGFSIMNALSEVGKYIKGYPHNPGDVCPLCAAVAVREAERDDI